MSLSSSFHLEQQLNAHVEGGASATGVLLTRPIVLPQNLMLEAGSQLKIEVALNVETSVSGTVVVELVSLTGSPIPGYRSLPIVGNDVRAPAVWNASFSPAAGTNFSVRAEPPVSILVS